MPSGGGYVEILGVRARVADSFLSRLAGLMFRKEPPQGEGLLITRCGTIHTCFMRFRIDAVFLDGDGGVVKVVKDIPPWRLCVRGGRRARQVLEIPSRSGPSAAKDAGQGSDLSIGN